MSRASVLAQGRAFLAGELVDTCLIDRVAAEDSNTLTGKVTRQWRPIYQGPCRFKQTDAVAKHVGGPKSVGEASLRLGALELRLPVAGTEGILVDDRVTVLTCAHDVELIGRVFVIGGQHHASFKVARGLPLTEVLS